MRFESSDIYFKIQIENAYITSGRPWLISQRFPQHLLRFEHESRYRGRTIETKNQNGGLVVSFVRRNLLFQINADARNRDTLFDFIAAFL